LASRKYFLLSKRGNFIALKKLCTLMLFPSDSKKNFSHRFTDLFKINWLRENIFSSQREEILLLSKNSAL
jgi:hypothetical protein